MVETQLAIDILSAFFILLFTCFVLSIPAIGVVAIVRTNKRMKEFKQWENSLKVGDRFSYINPFYHSGSPFDDDYDEEILDEVEIIDIKRNEQGQMFIKYKWDKTDKIEYEDSDTFHEYFCEKIGSL
jgi:hypothetical protein